MFHKEGFKIIIISFFLLGIIILWSNYNIQKNYIRLAIQISCLISFIFILQFFRNPQRKITINKNYILAPADGRVVNIEKVFEKEYLKKECILISIFMSPLNVHVTRYPISGKILYSKYHKGKYLVAWHPKSSEKNERTTVAIHNEIFGTILYRQIAGAVARRIVNYAKENTIITQGEESGFIKFGSRLDIFIPLDSNIKLKINDKTKAGETLIAIKDGGY